MSRILRIALFTGSALCAAVVYGQKSKVPDPSLLDDIASEDPAANVDWAKLVAVRPDAPGNAKNGNVDRAAAISEAIARADTAKEFYTKHPKHKRAAVAKQMELFALFEADGSDNNDVKARLESAVKSFRRDASRPKADRAKIAQLYDSRQAVIGVKSLDQIAANAETAAKALVQEFPDQEDGYLWLLSLATDPRNSDGPRIANSVASDANAPAEFRKRAQLLYTRRSLIDKKLQDVAPQLAAAIGDSSGKLVVVYAWSVHSQPSLAIASLIAKRPKDAAVWIGINVDPATDRVEAEKAAKERAFVGSQIYDPDGIRSPLAQQLGIGSADYGLLVASDGKIGQCMDGYALLNALAFFHL